MDRASHRLTGSEQDNRIASAMMGTSTAGLTYRTRHNTQGSKQVTPEEIRDYMDSCRGVTAGRWQFACSCLGLPVTALSDRTERFEALGLTPTGMLRLLVLLGDYLIDGGATLPTWQMVRIVAVAREPERTEDDLPF